MQSIETKYFGPGYSRGSRIKATATGGQKSITVSYECALSLEENHDRAAMLLAKKLGWTEGVSPKFQLVRGGSKTGNVYVILAPWEVITPSSVEETNKKHGVRD